MLVSIVWLLCAGNVEKGAGEDVCTRDSLFSAQQQVKRQHLRLGAIKPSEDRPSGLQIAPSVFVLSDVHRNKMRLLL